MGAVKTAYLAAMEVRHEKALARMPVAVIVSFLEALGYTVTAP